MTEAFSENIPYGIINGERIEIARRARGLSRRTLANLIGRSEEWLRLIEKNKRPLDRLSTIIQIGDVLKISEFSELTRGQPVPSPTAWAEEADIDIAHALLFPPDVTDDPGENIHQVHRVINSTWDTWQCSPHRYSDTRKALPALLLAVESSAKHSPAKHQSAAAANLSHTYRLFAALLRRSGRYDLALLSADRAMTNAARSMDPLVGAAARGGLAEVLITLGRYGDARELCLTSAEQVGASGTPSPEVLSIQGALYLTAAIATAAEGDHLHAEKFLERARALGHCLGVDRNDFRSCFGPTDVEIHAVAISVRLGRYRQAIRLAENLEVTNLFAKARQARHFISLARAYTFDRNPAAAVFSLQKARKSCKEELIYNPGAYLSVHDLLLQDNASTRKELRDIACFTQSGKYTERRYSHPVRIH